MEIAANSTRYNHPIPDMRAFGKPRLGWLIPLVFVITSHSVLHASPLTETARQLAQKIVAASGPGAFALEVTNRSSLPEKSVREIRIALEAELLSAGVHATRREQSIGAIDIVLSESLREYVWTAEITAGPDEKKIALVSLPRALAGTPAVPLLPVILRASLVFSAPQPILDAAQVEMAGGARLFVLNGNQVAIYRHIAGNSALNGAANWELENALPISHSRIFPRDLRGRLLLRRDHLFDVYLPGVFCRSSAAMPLTLACNATDDPWPLTPDDGSPRAFFAASRNFFTGALSPGIGKIVNVTSFYSAAQLPRNGYTLWALTAVDGSLHLVDGMTDQFVRGAKWGSDLVTVHSACGIGTQLVATDVGDGYHDSVRAFEIGDREPVAVSYPAEFPGRITALWPDITGSAATAIVRRSDTGWYETYRISVTCN